MKTDDEPPPRLFTPLYWAAMTAGLLLVLAGAAFAVLAPGLGRTPGPQPGPHGALTGRGAHGRGAGPPSSPP